MSASWPFESCAYVVLWLVVRQARLDVDGQVRRTRAALVDRTTVEEAAGVLAHLYALEMIEARRLLEWLAEEQDRGLPQAAAAVIAEARR